MLKYSNSNHRSIFFLLVVLHLLTFQSVFSFEVGWYHRISSPEDIVDIRGSGSSHVLPYTAFSTDAAILNFLNQAALADLGVILELRREDVSASDVSAMQQFVERFDSHPAVIGWYSADEPGLHNLPPPVMETAYHAIKSRSEKPVYIVFSYVEMNRGDVEAYQNSFDVFLIDSYPYRRNTESTATAVPAWVDLVANARVISETIQKPWWNVLQSVGEVPRFNWGFRLPSYDETRFQIYWSVLNNVEGITYFAYYLAQDSIAFPSGPYPYDGYQWLDEVADEVLGEFQTIRSAVAGGDILSDPAVSDPRLHTRLYQDQDGSLLLLVVNPTEDSLTATVTLPTGGWDLQPVGNPESAELIGASGDTLTLGMAPYGTFVCRVFSGWVQAEVSNEPLTENLLVANEAPIAGIPLINWDALTGSVNSDWRDVGQSFQAPANSRWDGLSLQIWDAGVRAAGAAFTVHVYESSTGGSAAGTLVATRHGILPEGSWTTSAAGKHLVLRFDTSIFLAGGKYYTAMLHFDERGSGVSGNPGSDRRMRFSGTASSTVPGWGGNDPRIFRHDSPFIGAPVVAYASNSEYALKLYVQGQILEEPEAFNVVTIEENPPETGVVVSNTAASSGVAAADWMALAGTNPSLWRDAGQSFQAPANDLWRGFALKIFDASALAPGSRFQVQIYESEVGGASVGGLIAKSDGILPTGTWHQTASNRFLTVTFDQPVPMTAGNYYTVMLHFYERGTGPEGNPGADRRIRFAGSMASTIVGWGGDDPRIFRQDSPFTSGPFRAYASNPEYALNIHIVGSVPEDLPDLRIGAGEHSPLAVSWPAPSDWVLEESSDLEVWTTVPGPYLIVDDRHTVEFDTSTDRRFFRLRKEGE